MSEALSFQTVPATLALLEIFGASVSVALAESFSDPNTTGATRRVCARQVPAGASLDTFEYGRFPPEWQDAELQLYSKLKRGSLVHPFSHGISFPHKDLVT